MGSLAEVVQLRYPRTVGGRHKKPANSVRPPEEVGVLGCPLVRSWHPIIEHQLSERAGVGWDPELENSFPMLSVGWDDDPE